MKSKLTELQEPRFCCVGVRKTTFCFALLQAMLLFFCLAIYVIGVLRATHHDSTGYYVAESDTLLTVSIRDGVYADLVDADVRPVKEQPQRDMATQVVDSVKPQMALDTTLGDNQNVADASSVPREVADEPYRNVQLRIAEDYNDASITTCRGRRDCLLVLGTVGAAFCLTVLVLIGVLRAKPTYLLPYCCMLLCDLVLTAGVLLTACLYIRNAREWIVLERNVDMIFKEHLLRLSDGELHFVLVLIGSALFTIKITWFLIVCRCYSFLVELSNRRLLNKYGLAEITTPFALGHHRAGSAGFVRSCQVDPILKHSRNRSDVQLPVSMMLPPSYDETQRTSHQVEKLLQTKQE